MLTGTANRTTRLLGAGALVATAGVFWFGLHATPPDVVQGQLVRLIYVHPAVSTMAFVAFGMTALASILYLIPRTRSWRWDRIAVATPSCNRICASMPGTLEIAGGGAAEPSSHAATERYASFARLSTMAW